MLAPARALALAVPAVLLAGAWGSQLWGGLYPCEMCHWQRWAHYGAVVAALLAILLRRSAASLPLTILAGLLILTSGAIGLFHTGVEYHWWPGLTRCSAMTPAGGSLRDLLAMPLIRCDAAQWSLWGVSLAGWNALFSLAGGGAVLALCLRRAR